MAGSVAGDAERAGGKWWVGVGDRAKAGENERGRDRRTGGEGLQDTQETRRIHSGERCLNTVVNPLQGLVSCQTS